MSRLPAAAALLGGLVAAPVAAELRIARPVQPLSTTWQQLPVENRGGTLLGISFRPPQVDALGLDPRATLERLLGYPFQLIRLGAYWNRMEPAPSQFATAELDWQVDAAERAGKQIVLCVGALKTFGYPEFFVPAHHLPRPIEEGSLVRPATHRSLLEAATAFVTRVVERYRDRGPVVGWQIEHEAVDPLGLEHSWRLSTEFVEAEISAVRGADPNRPILLNGFLPTSLLGGAQQWWRTRDQGDSLDFAIRAADIVGIDFYPRIGLMTLGPLAVYLDGSRSLWSQRQREHLLARARAAGRQVMVTESQAEPWETVTNPPNPTNGVMASCPPERLIENYNQCMRWLRASGGYAFLFWGAEYWIAREQHGDPTYARAFARVLEEA
jgi:Beta-galactosidase